MAPGNYKTRLPDAYLITPSNEDPNEKSISSYTEEERRRRSVDYEIFSSSSLSYLLKSILKPPSALTDNIFEIWMW